MSIKTREECLRNPDSEPFVIHAAFGDSKRRVVAVCSGEPLVKQSFKDDCDVNIILDRYVKTGVLPESVGTLVPRYEDVSEAPDFFQAIMTVQRAEAAFMAQPAEVRARFSNDPGMMMAFLDNPDNREEGVKLGLLVPREPDLGVVDTVLEGNVPSS